LTGQEIEINSEVAFSGLSLMKIAILEETYRVRDGSPDTRAVGWLSEALGPADDNAAANMLLSDVIGGGDVYLGVETLTMSLGQLRLLNTFIAAPFDAENVSLTISTPANSRKDVFANPTPHMQTTPLDMGLLLEMIHQCSQGGGMLQAVYPDAFTVQECGQMLGWLSGDSSDTAVLIETGVPGDIEVLHRYGFTGDTHADAGIVSGPNGDFVLVLFVHRPGWLEWEDSSSLVSDITAAVYNYYAASPR
ncbi:MAG: class A beta-lactamase-related serine hydrolase, partial [Anaerolineae bacterium]|nr:class A beta-lactamase-related serine hydrolase [Anaerolineae bacterium]